MNKMIKYEPLMEITTYSKKKYYILAKDMEALEKALEVKKFMRFWNSTVNVASIDTIEEAKPEDNFYQAELQKYTYDEQNRIKNEVKLWKAKTHKNLTPSVLTQIIDTYIKKL